MFKIVKKKYKEGDGERDLGERREETAVRCHI